MKHPDHITMLRLPGASIITRYGWAAIFAICTFATGAAFIYLALTQSKP